MVPYYVYSRRLYPRRRGRGLGWEPDLGIRRSQGHGVDVVPRSDMRTLQTFEYEGTVLPLFAYGSATPNPAEPPLAGGIARAGLDIGDIDLHLDGEELTLKANVTGRNLAFIYSEVLIKDPDHDRYYGPLLREHVRAERTKAIRGLHHPQWDESNDLVLRVAVRLPVLTDGVESALCCLTAENYERPDHRMRGLFTPAGSGVPLPADCSIDESGAIRGIIGYKERGGRSLPRPLTPARGDSFGPFVPVVIPVGDCGDWRVDTAISPPLTFLDRRLYVEMRSPLPGEYLVGLAVQDTDGGLVRRCVPLSL